MVASELRNGTTYLQDGAPLKVIRYSHIKMGRGGATVRINARNLLTGGVGEYTFSSTVKVDEVQTQKKIMQYLYSDGATVATFMDPSTFEQIEVPIKVIQDELPYIKEGENATLLFWDERVLSIDIPPKVVLTVTDTDPGVKGNSASNMYKSATLENGVQIKVPLFIDKGEKIRVDTRSGEYVERAK
jgi:elongation factor P